MSDKYFFTLLEMYERLDIDNKHSIVYILKESSKAKFFVDFLSNYLRDSSFDINRVYDFTIDFGILACSILTPEYKKKFTEVFIQILSKKPITTSFTLFSGFLVQLFSSSDNENKNDIFDALLKLPQDVSVLPITYFALQNEDYLQKAFDIASSSHEKLLETATGILWLQSLILLFKNAKGKVKYEKSSAYASAEVGLSYQKGIISQRFQLLSAIMDFFDDESKLNLIQAHFVNLCSDLDPSILDDDIAFAFETIVKIFGFVSENSSIDKVALLNVIFTKVLPLYRPYPKLDENIVKFCELVDRNILEQNIERFVRENKSAMITFFLISRFPSDKFVIHLIGHSKSDSTSFQYSCIIHYLSNNTIYAKYIPELFATLSPSDIEILNRLLDVMPHLYLTGALRYLEVSNDMSKIETIAKALSSRKTIPIVDSKSVNGAFINVSIHTLQSENTCFHLYVLMEYLYFCSMKKKGDLSDDEFLDNASNKIHIMNINAEYEGETAKNENENEFMFVVPTDDISFTAPSHVVRDICHRSQEWCTDLTNKTIEHFKAGNSQYGLLIAAISGDIKLIENCINILLGERSLLIHFFAVLTSSVPAVAMKVIRQFVSEDSKSESIFRKKNAKKIDGRMDIVIHSLITMAPIVAHSEELNSILSLVFAGAGNSDQQRLSFAFEAVKAICTYIKEPSILSPVITLMLPCEKYVDGVTFIATLTAAVKANNEFSEHLASDISDCWFECLIGGMKTDKSCEFEKYFLDDRFGESHIQIFLRKLDKYFASSEECQSLYECLSRVFYYKGLEKPYLKKYITLCISSSLSEVKEIRGFCISTLIDFHKLKNNIMNVDVTEFNYSTYDLVSPFYDELSSKYLNTQGPYLLEAILLRYGSSKQNSKIASILFAESLVRQNPSLFASSNINFVHIIVEITNNVDLKSYDFILFSHLLLKLALCDMNGFFIQFNEIKLNKFIIKFIETSYTTVEFRNKFNQLVLNNFSTLITDYTLENYKKNLYYMKHYVIKSISMFSTDEELSLVLFSILLLISTFNILVTNQRNDLGSSNSLTTILETLGEKTLFVFNKKYIEFGGSKSFPTNVHEFVKHVNRFSNHTVELFLKKIYTLCGTVHKPAGSVVFSFIMTSYSNKYNESSKQILESTISLYFKFIQSDSINDEAVYESLLFAMTSFTVDNFKLFDIGQLSLLLDICIDKLERYREYCLAVIRLMVDCSPNEFLETQAGSLLACLRIINDSSEYDDECIQILLKIVTIRCDPKWFVKKSSLSYGTFVSRILFKRCKTSVALLKKILKLNDDSDSLEWEVVFCSMLANFANVDNSKKSFVEFSAEIVDSIMKNSIDPEQLVVLTGLMTVISSLSTTANDTVSNFVNFIKGCAIKNGDSEFTQKVVESLTKISF